MSDKIIELKQKSIKPVDVKKGEFDFDYWSKLAKKDPEAFEAAREAEINKHIASIGDEETQERIRRLQWRVDIERERSSSPLEAAGRIYDMMWESVGRNIKVLDELVDLVNPHSQSKKKAEPVKKHNTVLAFKRKEVDTAEVATAE